MGVAALFAWLTTGSLGFAMLATWLGRISSSRRAWNGRPVTGRPPPYIPVPLVIVHLLLAVGGLIVWSFYLAVDANVLAWVALAMLLPVDLLGLSMFIRWLGSRRLRRAGRGHPGPAESLIPTVIVFSHGVGGVVTLSLVTLATLGIGGS
jgi:hypothetical protein